MKLHALEYPHIHTCTAQSKREATGREHKGGDSNSPNRIKNNRPPYVVVRPEGPEVVSQAVGRDGSHIDDEGAAGDAGEVGGLLAVVRHDGASADGERYVGRQVLHHEVRHVVRERLLGVDGADEVRDAC